MVSCQSTTICIIISLFVVVGIPLLFIFDKKNSDGPKFTVESTVVKAYNLSSDNRLFCIINLGIRAHNPNLKKKTFDIYGIDMTMRKGKHHKLADDALLSFRVGPGNAVVVDVEAVGLHVALERKIAEEIRADMVAGEGRVNVFMSGYVGSDYLDVTCKNVVVDFLMSTIIKVQKVDCKFTVTTPDTGA